MPGAALPPRPTADATDSTLLRVSGLQVHFSRSSGGLLQRQAETVRAVDGVDLSVRKGETLGLVGESGCGKSTLGRAILQLLTPTSGSVALDGIELTGMSEQQLRPFRRRMQMVFQNPYASLDPRMTVEKIISEPLHVHGIGAKRERSERVQALLRLVGLDRSFAERYPHEFSGGQRQRIGIARAIAVEPDLIIADEPISALDVSIQAQIINLLEDLQERLELAYVLVTHDLAVVRHIADRVAVMYLGRVVEVARANDLYEVPLHPYTQALLSAVPIPDPEIEERRRRIILLGDVPTAIAPPSGCRFHTRCFLRERLGNPEICSTVEPELAEHRTGQLAACHFAGQS